MPLSEHAGPTVAEIQEPQESRLRVNEIFFSIQGESTYSGLPCIFVRLAECNLRCGYCDTAYAFHEWVEMPIAQILDRVGSWDCNLVEVTGGEPLLQPETATLLRRLVERGKTVLLETGGSLDVSAVPKEVVIILDLKTPGSGMQARNLWSNLEILKPCDQIKFVICDRLDYEWSREVIRSRRLDERHTVLISPVWGTDLAEVAGWLLSDRLNARLQTQLHKWIWGAHARGV